MDKLVKFWRHCSNWSNLRTNIIPKCSSSPCSAIVLVSGSQIYVRGTVVRFILGPILSEFWGILQIWIYPCRFLTSATQVKLMDLFSCSTFGNTRNFLSSLAFVEEKCDTLIFLENKCIFLDNTLKLKTHYNVFMVWVDNKLFQL